MELSCSKIKNSLYFGTWNFLALIIRNVLYCLKQSFSYISGNGTFLYLGNGKPQKCPYSLGGASKPKNQNFLYFSKKCYE